MFILFNLTFRLRVYISSLWVRYIVTRAYRNIFFSCSLIKVSLTWKILPVWWHCAISSRNFWLSYWTFNVYSAFLRAISLLNCYRLPWSCKVRILEILLFSYRIIEGVEVFPVFSIDDNYSCFESWFPYMKVWEQW
jgi:hypothetical protein